MTGTVILSFAQGTDKPVPGADVCSKAGRGSALQRQMSRHNKRIEKTGRKKVQGLIIIVWKLLKYSQYSLSKSLSSLWPKNTEGVSHLHTKQCKNRLCIQGPTLCKNYQCFPTTSSFPSFACTAFLKPCLQIDTVLEIRCHKGPPLQY